MENQNRFEEVLEAQKGLVNILETHLDKDVFEKVKENYRKTVEGYERHFEANECHICKENLIQTEPSLEDSDSYSDGKCLVLGICNSTDCDGRYVTWTIKNHYMNMVRSQFREELLAVEKREKNIEEIEKLKEQIKELRKENTVLTRIKNKAKINLKKMYSKQIYDNHNLDEYKDMMEYSIRRYL